MNENLNVSEVSENIIENRNVGVNACANACANAGEIVSKCPEAGAGAKACATVGANAGVNVCAKAKDGLTVPANAPLLFDTHAHYDDEKFDPDRDDVISSLKSGGVGYVVDIGCSFDSIPKAMAIAEKYPFIYFTAGIHPNDAIDAEARPDTLDFLRKALSHPKAVALGEIGLDYHWTRSGRDVQKKWFDLQLSLAEELGLPVSVHDREAHGDTLEMLKRHPGSRGILHSFSGSAETAEELVGMGYYISFSGVLTFKNAEKLPEVARVVPPERMLLETDCPYLTPHPYRGKRNSSAYMYLTAAKLAEIKGMTYEEVCRITAENAARVYGIKEIFANCNSKLQ